MLIAIVAVTLFLMNIFGLWWMKIHIDYLSEKIEINHRYYKARLDLHSRVLGLHSRFMEARSK